MAFFSRDTMKLLGAIMVGLFTILGGVVAYLTYNQNNIDRSNQVSIFKDNKRLFGTEEVHYDITIHNGSNAVIYSVTVIAPENITETIDSKISFNEDGEPRGVNLGDIAPNGEIKKTFKMKQTENAQLKDFSIQYMSVESFFGFKMEKWWEKNSEGPPKEISIQEKQFK